MNRTRLVSVVAIYLAISFETLAYATDLFVPAYFYPVNGAGYWTQLATAARTAPTIAVLNPSSGPGASPDPNYAEAINSVHQFGVRVIGYVYTNYAYRSLDEVKRDIDSYISFYDEMISGFFIDQMTPDALDEHLSDKNILYYRAILTCYRFL